MLQAIKVGDVRIMLHQITNVVTVKDEPNLRIDVYLTSPDYSLAFSDTVARDFLRQFDALTGIAETDAAAEPEATPETAPETGTLRDALPFLREYVLEHFKNDLLCIIDSDAPEAAKKEARALRAAINAEKRNRPRHSVYEMDSTTED